MTGQEIAQLVASLGAGAFGGLAQGQQNKLSQSQQTQNQLDLNIQRLMAALQNSQQTGQNLQTNRQNMPQAQANASPLGQEQTFLQRQRLMSAMLPEMAKFNVGGPTDPKIQAAYRPPTNMLQGLANPALQQSFGDQATANSLAERRKLMAQINPQHQFSSLGEFGLDSKYDQGVTQAGIDSGAQLKAYEAAQASLANQQTQLAQQQLVTAQQQAANPQKKGGGVLGAIGGLLKGAAPLAALIPGVGPALSIGIGAGAGVLGDKMQGNSLGHALGAGALTGLGTLGGEALQSRAQGQGFNPFNNGQGPQLNNQMSQLSLPVSGQMSNFNPATLNLPSSNSLGLSQFAGSVSQNMSGLPQSGQRSPQQYAPKPPVPFASGHGPQPQAQGQPNLMQRLNGGMNTQQALAEIMNNPMLKGYQQGGPGMGQGAVGSAPAVGGFMRQLLMGNPQTGVSRAPVTQMPQQITQMTQVANSGRAARNSQFDQMYQQGVNAPNANTGLNAKSILEVLSGNSLTVQQKAQFLASPQAQAILRSLPTASR